MNYSEKWKAERERRAYLALADGTVFHGVAFGAKKDALGEVVFNTGMCGYQEILTELFLYLKFVFFYQIRGFHPK